MSLTGNKQFALFVLLALVMSATRSHHFDSLSHLPDASLAVFVLAGSLLPLAAFPALLSVAGLADYFALNVDGIGNWCFSPAYWFLIPTYAVLWVAGGYCAKLRQDSLKSLGLFSAISFAALSVAFLISNYSFYLFSGRYSDMNMSEYASRVAQYYLPYVASAVIYLVPAVLFYAVFARRIHLAKYAG